MSFIIEDGMGSTQKVSVFNNRVRSFAEEVSLMNHISGESSEKFIPPEAFFGEGVYNITQKGSILAGPISFTFMRFFNNDHVNLMIIDRVYIQVISTTVTLPNPNFTAEFLFAQSVSTPSNITTINENQSVNIKPNVIQSIAQVMGNFQVFPTLGDIIELIPQKSDSIICNKGQGMGILFNNLTSGTMTFQAFARFAVIDPDSIG